MKSEQTIKKWIKELQELTERDKTPSLESRLAYFSYHLLRRVVEDVKWDSISNDLKETASIIQRDMDERGS